MLLTVHMHQSMTLLGLQTLFSISNCLSFCVCWAKEMQMLVTVWMTFLPRSVAAPMPFSLCRISFLWLRYQYWFIGKLWFSPLPYVHLTNHKLHSYKLFWWFQCRLWGLLFSFCFALCQAVCVVLSSVG